MAKISAMSTLAGNDDGVRRYENTQDERYWNIKEKLEKLIERVTRYDDFDSRVEEREWKLNRELMIKTYTSFFETGKITKSCLNFANKLWKKYK